MANATLKRPREAFCVEWEGFTQTFNTERVFESTHPLVKAYPDRFEPVVPIAVDRLEEVTR